MKAIKELNNTLFKGRKIILDLSVPKDMYSSFSKKGPDGETKEEEQDEDEEVA